MKFFKEHKWFSIILLMAAIIRLIPLGEYQFSFDELSALNRTTYANWHDLVMYGARIDAHPILIQCLLYAIIKLVGYSEVWIKLPFIIFSLVAVFYAYKIALKWFGELPALLVASVYSFSFIFLYYSPLARMYASGLFFCTALLYFWMNVLFDEKKNKRDYWLMALFILLCALNAHLSTLFALTLGLAGLFYQNRTTVMMYLMACLIPVICYLPHLPITMFQLTYGGIGAQQNGWLPPPGKWAVFEFIAASLGNGWLWLLFVFITMISLVVNKLQNITKKSVLLLIIFLVNYFIIYFYSVFKAPVFQFSVMLFSAPALLIGLLGLIQLKKCYTLPLVFTIGSVLFYESVFAKEFFTSAVLNQNEFAYNELKSLYAKYGQKNVDAVFYDTEKYFVMHYELQDGKKLNYHMGYEEEFVNVGKFKRFLANSKVQKLLIGNPSITQIELVKLYFPYLEKFTETTNVSCYVFSKTPESKINVEPVECLSTSVFKGEGSYNYNLNNEKWNNDTHELKVDNQDEYPFSLTAEIDKVAFTPGNVVLAELSINSDTIIHDASFNCVIKNEKDSTLYFGGPEINGFYLKDKTYKVYCELFIGSDFESWKKQNSRLTFFVWNRGKNKLQIKNASARTYNYRPKRWSLFK